ncbi:uncharacterized protein LOC112520889 [Cynara cardunculus var. scolymus]|uniref:uncharacterized protein LOC112520889 n=1 Tax=Cynara cardunculus var. scolymus TaxID=59895 RepID=UPI000D62541E|nr:uncharacterized protein LOC112520889 [Cynara cardunculus var. scolymus]
MVYESQEIDIKIYNAVIRDKWDFVSKIFQEKPELQIKPISWRLETPLMIAVGTNQSHDFVRNLLQSLNNDHDLINCAMEAKNDEGDTALHYATKVGNMIDAILLLTYSSKPEEMALQKNRDGTTALLYAARCGRKKEMLVYLYSLTSVFLNPLNSRNPTRTLFLGPLLTNAIDAGFLDVALNLVEAYSKGVLGGTLYDSQKSLSVLAGKPELFYSGKKLGFWRRLIYNSLHVDEKRSKLMTPVDEKTTSKRYAHDMETAYTAKEFSNYNYKRTSATTGIKRMFQYLASPIKGIYDLKLTHKQSHHLLNCICKMVIEKGDQDIVSALFVSTVNKAVEYANYEVLKECILTYPSIMWSVSWSDFEHRHIFYEAIKQRQEQVYDLVKEMNSYKGVVLNHTDENTNENVLHIAAKLAPPHRLNIVTGAALQMQQELQWFQEIEDFVEPSLRGGENNDKKTPRMLFTDEHKELLKEGKEWMKDTASASSVVATLIVTMAFAAVFTLPGILTSRYGEADFLHVLPRRLMGGLFTLFVSLAATMITFSATLALVLQDKCNWIAVPLVIITSIPVGLFAIIQFPLLIELFYVTYGPTIFRKRYKKVFL